MECPNCNAMLPFYAALAHGGTRIRCRTCNTRLKPQSLTVERVTERTGLGGVLPGGPTGGIAMLVGLLAGVTGSSVLYAARHLRFEPEHTPR